MRFDFAVDGRVRAVSRGRDGFSYFLDHLKETEVVTNLANGKTITAVNTYTRKDLKLTDNGDGTLTAVELLTGMTVLYRADGKAIARTTGQSRWEFLIDHGGTPNDPFDDELIADLGRVQRAGRSDDLCEAAVSALT